MGGHRGSGGQSHFSQVKVKFYRSCICVCVSGFAYVLAEYVVQYFTEYGPSFDLDVMPGYVRNLNTEAYTESVVSTIWSTFSDTVLLSLSVEFTRNTFCGTICLSYC